MRIDQSVKIISLGALLLSAGCSSLGTDEKIQFTSLESKPKAEVLRILDEVAVRETPDGTTSSSKEKRAPASDILRCNDEQNKPKYIQYDYNKIYAKLKRKRPFGQCQDSRAKVLISKSVDPVSFNPRSALGPQCVVEAGLWIDQFTDDSDKEKIKKADDLVVTTLIPLENAHRTGAWTWPDSVKYSFVNNADDENHLVVMTKTEMNARADKSPEEYLPENSEFQCEYVGSWIRTKRAWGLCMTQKEEKFVTEFRDSCITSFRRKSYTHWQDNDHDCFDTRQETLLHDRNKGVETAFEMGPKNCVITKSAWYDWYSYDEKLKKPPVITDPKEIDVDHIVPLKEAHRSGAWAWSKDKKAKFANMLDDKLPHLLAVSASENRSKGDRPPQEYMPNNPDFKCRYLELWTRIKRKWDLTMSLPEKVFIGAELNKCYRQPASE